MDGTTLYLDEYGCKITAPNVEPKVVPVSAIYDILKKEQIISTPFLPLNCRYYFKHGRTHILALEFEPNIYDVSYRGTLDFYAPIAPGVIITDLRGELKQLADINVDSSEGHPELIEVAELDDEQGEEWIDDEQGEEWIDDEQGEEWIDDEDEIFPEEDEDENNRQFYRGVGAGIAKFKIPTPHLLYFVVLGRENDEYFIRADYMFSLQEPLNSLEDRLFFCPFGNVSASDHSLCWDGARALKGFARLISLSGIPSFFFGSHFNRDLDRSLKWLGRCFGYKGAIDTLNLFNLIHGKKSFPNEALNAVSITPIEFLEDLVGTYANG